MATKKRNQISKLRKNLLPVSRHPRRRQARRKRLAKNAAAKKSPAPKKTNPKSATRKIAPQKSVQSRPRKWFRGKREDLDALELPPVTANARSAGQSGSLQGLSDVETADSESVDELIEEGNSFEARSGKEMWKTPLILTRTKFTPHERPED